jgi:branched-subunit amino acid aminotransferase/4-amino-4-deoxychorismate lyase
MTLTEVPIKDFSWAEPALRELLRRDPAAAVRSLGIDPPSNAPTDALIEVVKLKSMIWQDGQVIPKRDFRFSPDDEGLLFGRGVWESTRTFHGRPWLWETHLERLRHTAKLLNIPVIADQLPNEIEVSRFVKGLTTMDVVIRLNLSAGSYQQPGTVWMSASLPSPTMPSIRLKSCPNPVPADQPYLVWKTFQYATRLRVGRQVPPGFDSTLLVDPEGHLLEAAHANVFVRLDSGWTTPMAAQGGLLPGTVRRHLLHYSPFPITERKVAISELAAIREAFVTNSNVGIVPISRIDDHEYPIGQETRELSHWLIPRSPYQTEATTVSMI